MPIKWKIFKIIQFTALVIFTPVILLDIYGIFTKPVSRNDFNGFVLGQAIFMLITFIYCGNILFNLKLLTVILIKNQADTSNRRVSTILLILFILILIIFAIVFPSVLYTKFVLSRAYAEPAEPFFFYFLLYLFVLIVMGIYISIMQVKLLRLIGHHKKDRVNSIIESIGSTEKEGGK
jgi:hypothetical protein